MDSYGQKPGYLHNLGTRIPQYLFTAPDASTHIFEFLSDPILQGFAGAGSSGGSVLNWTDYCGFGGSATTIPLGAGPFLGCLLYHNVTRNVRDGILPSNLTSVGFSSTNDTVDRVSSLVKTIIPTCLVAYCSSQPDCAATPMCDVGRLFTNDYQLSAQGVANCWQSLCSLNVQSVNSDIAGVGILISYLLQSIVALLGLCILAALACAVYFYDRRASACATETTIAKGYRLRLRQARHQWEIANVCLAEFHKSQCYFAIALQIASCVVIFSDLKSTIYSDQNFLLLVSLDGLIPVVLTLYTLMAFGKKSWYMIILSLIPVVLASITGGYLATKVLLTQEADATVISVTGGGWPATCGNIGPGVFCAGMGPNVYGYGDTSGSFLGIMALLDVITGLLILWKLLTDYTTLWETTTKWLAGKLTTPRSEHHLAVTDDAYHRSLRRVQTTSRVICHSVAASAILACLGVEFYYFFVIFISAFVDFHSWSFGQIVGITTWAAVFIEFGYLQYFGLDRGQEWRFPRWLRVRAESESTSQTTTTSPPPPAELQLEDRKDTVGSTTDTLGKESMMTASPAGPEKAQSYSRALNFERNVQ